LKITWPLFYGHRTKQSNYWLLLFLNVAIAFRVYLTLPVANYTKGERSSSVLKIARVLNQQRSTVDQDKLCDLSFLTIEADLTNNIDFECFVSEFCEIDKKKKKQCR